MSAKAERFAREMKMLQHFHLSPAGETRPLNFQIHAQPLSAFISVAGTWWLLVENGGEIMVERVNSGELAQAVPLARWGTELNAATIAGRISEVLRGLPVHYECDVSAQDEATLLGAGA